MRATLDVRMWLRVRRGIAAVGHVVGWLLLVDVVVGALVGHVRAALQVGVVEEAGVEGVDAEEGAEGGVVAEEEEEEVDRVTILGYSWNDDGMDTGIPWSGSKWC